MAHVEPHQVGDGDPPRREDDPHRPTGLELEGLGAGDALSQEERRLHLALPRVFRWLDSVIRVVMVVLLAVLVVAVGANVFGRFVLDQSLAGTDELARFLFIWVIFLGAALAHLHREHIAVTLAVEKLPRGLQRWAVVVQELAILVVVVALLISAREVIAISSGDSPLLRVPLTWINASVPLCAGVMGLITLYRIAEALRPSRGTKG